jgi:cysteinyl-tRNA synthetase
MAKLTGLEERFQKVMDNDFNTAQAIAQLFDTVKILNKVIRTLPVNPNQNDLEVLRNTSSKIKELAGIMGLLTEDPIEHTKAVQNELLEKLDLETEAIERLIQERTLARQNKDWARGDAIRDELLAKGVELKDGPEGTTWKVKV